MARNQKKQEQESVPETPATTSSAAEQAAEQATEPGAESQQVVTHDQFDKKFEEFRQQMMEMFKHQSESITNQIYKVINETNAAQAEAIAVNHERENILDEQAKRIVDGAQEKFDHVDEHVEAQADFIQATAQKVDELAAKMERQRSDPTFGHDNDAPPGHWNVPPTADHAFGPPPPQAYGATPNEFGFEPYEDEPSPVSPREIAVQIRRVMPTFNVQAPQMHGSMNNKAPPIVDAFMITNSDDDHLVFKVQQLQSYFVSMNLDYQFWAHAAAPYLKGDLIHAFQTALQYPIGPQISWLDIGYRIYLIRNWELLDRKTVSQMYLMLPTPGESVTMFIARFRQLANNLIPYRNRFIQERSLILQKLEDHFAVLLALHSLDYVNPPDIFYKKLNHIFHNINFPDDLPTNDFQVNYVRNNNYQPQYQNQNYNTRYNSKSSGNNYRGNKSRRNNYRRSNQRSSYQSNNSQPKFRYNKFRGDYSSAQQQGKQLYELDVVDPEADALAFDELDGSDAVSEAPYDSGNESNPESTYSDDSARPRYA